MQKNAPVKRPGIVVSLTPVVCLLLTLISIVIFKGADAISEYSSYALLAASGLGIILSILTRGLSLRGVKTGYFRSARQILPAIPILLSIALISTTWMLSGVVPLLINYGLSILNPTFFLVITCGVCGIISVLTGSSWSTIATIGVAFMGIGTVLGFNPAMTAGAIISGAYFGDKMSPLSDTTVVASSSCGVDLFEHIRYMMITTVPAMTIALTVFLILGLTTDVNGYSDSATLIDSLRKTFNLSPWLLVIPAVTGILIAMKVNTLLTLVVSSLLGLSGIIIFQPSICHEITSGCNTMADQIAAFVKVLWTDFSLSTGNDRLDELAATGGITGMLPTIELILSAMIFGAVLIGTGMLSTITGTFSRSLRKRTTLVGVTVGSGLALNSCTADQYLSLIISGNMYRNVYRRMNLEPRLLSRTIEDSVSVTSVLIPWNSCGVTQSAVLGVATLSYLPFCVFNYLCPLVSIFMAWTGFRIRSRIIAARTATA